MIYPTLVRIDTEEDMQNEKNDGDSDQITLPAPLRLSSSVISVDGTYYLDTGSIAYVFTGEASQYRCLEGIEGRMALPEGKEHTRIRRMMEYIVRGRSVEPVMYSVHQSGHAFLLDMFQGALLEDGGSAVSASYQDFVNKLVAKVYAGK